MSHPHLITEAPTPPHPHPPSLSPPSPRFPSSSLTAVSVLPHPLYLQDSNLYTHLTHGIQTKFGLTAPEQLVLLAVLKHIPLGSSRDENAATTALIDRIITLEPAHIKRLAEILTTGLLDARSWGGSRKSVCSRALSRQSIGDSLPDTVSAGTGSLAIDSSDSDIFQHLDITPFPHQISVTDHPPGGSASPPQPLRRNTTHSRACIKRKASRCPLTTRPDIALETAHLIPHSVAALKKSDTPFWLLLAISLGPDLRDHLYSIICGTNSYSTTNGLVLDSTMHKFFDKGVFYLVPLPEPTFDTRTSRHLDVFFRWKHSPDGLSLCFTRLPTEPEVQTYITASGSTAQTLAVPPRQINDGDIFRLFTDDPARLPLPHPLLLSLHAMLWEMIGSAGLNETGQEKRKRLQRPMAPGDSGDSSDGAHCNARKRVKRKSRKHGKRKEILSHPQPEEEQLGSVDTGGPSYQARACHPGPDGAPCLSGSSHTVDNAPPNYNNANGTSAPKPQRSNMTFLDREYLEFKLWQLRDGHLDFDLNDDDEDESDTSSCNGNSCSSGDETWPESPAGCDGIFRQREYGDRKRHQDDVESSSDGDLSEEDDSSEEEPLFVSDSTSPDGCGLGKVDGEAVPILNDL